MPLGELSIGILRAVNDSGLKASGLKIMGTGDITDETYIDAVGDAALGTITTGIYSTQHDSPMNKEFVKDYVALNGATPRMGWGAIATWDALRLTYDALNAQAGAKFDPDKFVSFVHGHTFESPRGPVTIDKANGDIIQNIYIRRVDKVNGVLQNVEIESFKDVGFK
jgi:branched-chain amino acid transport system substrate-binding protein